MILRERGKQPARLSTSPAPPFLVLSEAYASSKNFQKLASVGLPLRIVIKAHVTHEEELKDYYP